MPESAPGLSRLQTRRALRLWTLEGCVATVQISLTGGAFQTGFALFLGCTPFWLGALGGIPALAGLVQLFSSFLAQRYGNRKPLVMWFALVSRLLWVPMLLIPFALPRPLWVGTFLTLTLISSLLANVAQPLWTAWITDLVPEDNRGRYFGRRNMYAGWVGLLVPIVGGYFLDAATKQHEMSQMVAFAIIFASATVFGFGSFAAASQSPDVPQRKPGADGEVRESALAYYRAPFADRNFQRLIAYVALMVVAQSIAGQFFTVYQLQYLGLNYTAFQLLSAVASLGSLASMPLWGYLADKYGNKPILMICCASSVWCRRCSGSWPRRMASLGCGGMTGQHHLRVSLTKLDVMVLNVFAGVGWAGVGLTQFNLMIGIAPSEKRTVYVSAIAAVAGLAGGLAPVAGGALMEAMAGFHGTSEGLIRNNYHVLFLLSAVLRGAAMFLVGPIGEAGSQQTRYVLTAAQGVQAHRVVHGDPEAGAGGQFAGQSRGGGGIGSAEDATGRGRTRAGTGRRRPAGSRAGGRGPRGDSGRAGDHAAGPQADRSGLGHQRPCRDRFRARSAIMPPCLPWPPPPSSARRRASWPPWRPWDVCRMPA